MDIETGLDNLLRGQFDAALAEFEGCGQQPTAEKLCELTRACADLSAYAAALAEGDLSVRPPKSCRHFSTHLESLHAKLKRLARQLLIFSAGYPMPAVDDMGDLSDGLTFLINQAQTCKKQVEHDQNHDVETGLMNRRAFVRGVREALQMQPGKFGVLLSCGLDNLKYVNESHGYDGGDLYISKVVEALQMCENDAVLLARTAGSEFAVFAHGFDNEESALRFAQDNRKTLLNTTIELPNEVVRIRASLGVAVYPSDAMTGDVLMNYASHAMFEVQNFNRGTLMRFNPEVYRAKANILSRQERLDELLEGQLIRFAFQPIVSLKDGSIYGYEALMRSTTPHFASPLDVLQLAEAQSKLPQLEHMTFRMIFDWMDKNLPSLGARKIFFNAISAQYLDARELRNMHPRYEDISRNMVFEIIETASSEEGLAQKVRELRTELAAFIAIDDFGCAHSNALRLLNISPEILKIDSFFIRAIHKAPASKREFLSNILVYCRSKGILTVAEGVETCEELASVVALGFDLAQGFYLARPEFVLQELAPSQIEEITALKRTV
ncbi:GGDEF domain-containing protein [Desulfovibrio sp.]|uniref:bifunctional diguanylate cyclase/phosphodiesterase n=1 Tax=Desulfovibrio sp. TaxID=885 RepID=UPI0025C10657|nr:GGDEF domain-containing protein [Desulfovibrio sp.]